ncbi:polymer-forming cytoskeletal protein [Candidatus Margulisiibacteriota bacterium]
MSILGPKKKVTDYVGVNSIIGEDTFIKGEINTKGSVRIGGHFEGTLSAQGDVLVGEGSKVEGNVSAARVIVSGDLNGNVIANGGLEVTRTGKVFGDITCDKIVVDEGAVYKGKVNLESSVQKD